MSFSNIYSDLQQTAKLEELYQRSLGNNETESHKNIHNYSSSDYFQDYDLSERYLVVCGIDFGTTYCGYAFCFSRTCKNIHIMKSTDHNVSSLNQNKIPTVLLLTEDLKFQSFGNEAKHFYSELSKADAKKYYLFEKFKMILHSTSKINSDIQIQASNGKFAPAVTVFIESLKHLKSMFIKSLEQQTSAKIKASDIRWVLTVPAIWRDNAKQFMRKVALKAGMGSKYDKGSLLIALEPEAASIYCRTLRLRDCLLEDDIKNIEFNETINVDEKLRDFKKYIIVDCGGGTVDISVHELDYESETLTEIKRGLGGPYGATMVDKNFVNFLIQIFGENFINYYNRKYPAGWIELVDSFDSKKRLSRPFEDSPKNIQIPFSMFKAYKKFCKKSLENKIKKKRNFGVNFSDQGMLRIEAGIMISFFTTVITNIKEYVHEILADPETCDVQIMFLVGGFSESLILQNEMRVEFANRLKLIVPYEASLAVLKGSVMFGTNPYVIRIRRSKFTYGIRSLKPFNENIHNPAKLIVLNSKKYCKDLLSIFVNADESIGSGKKVRKAFKKNSEDQKEFLIELYKSKEKYVRYTTDPGVKVCGNLKIDCSTIKGSNAVIDVTIIFGEVEMRVVARNMETNEIVDSKLDFLQY